MDFLYCALSVILSILFLVVNAEVLAWYSPDHA